MKRKEFLIDYKGTLRSNEDSKIEISEIKYSNQGQIRLNGTDKDLDIFLRDLVNNSDFELIKVHDLNEVTAIVDVYKINREIDSVFWIQEKRYFDQESQPKAKTNISKIVNLIKEHGSDDNDVIEFLSTDGPFEFKIEREGLRDYIRKNPLK